MIGAEIIIKGCKNQVAAVGSAALLLLLAAPCHSQAPNMENA
jgi:hypothetical protein